ncbi:hypothetical protein [Alcanivorax sp.]|uniref:hypothetical protein n=1 Tax=Alcanivorax sp. TaxID=1872427 RepID=UPI0025C35055|nr:hypothetical protein [Alcanivorax sp.]
MSVDGGAMPEGAIAEEIKSASGKSISAILSPAKRARNYQLGVSWWSYPIHCLVWLLFLVIIAGTIYFSFESGVMGISIAELLMWGFSLYVILFMLMSASRDKRLSGARKFNFYFSYGSACVLKALWMSTALFLAAMWVGAARDPLLVGSIHGSVDMEVGGYWFDDMDFASSMVFWLVLYMGFAGRRAGNE